jgi:predicted transcriptional regulator
VAAEAAGRGLDVVVVSTMDLAGRVTDRLRDAGLSYGLCYAHDVIVPRKPSRRS